MLHLATFGVNCHEAEFFRLSVSPSETKTEPDHRLRFVQLVSLQNCGTGYTKKCLISFGGRFDFRRSLGSGFPPFFGGGGGVSAGSFPEKRLVIKPTSVGSGEQMAYQYT